MPRFFVIVAEAPSVVPDFKNRFREVDKVRRSNPARCNQLIALPVDRMKRVLRKDMLDIGHEQLLMLLFVMQPNGKNRFHFHEQFFFRLPE